MHRVAAAVLIATLYPAVSRADTTSDPGAPAPGEDAQLYSCKSHTTEVAVQFKPEMDVHELMSWVMGFTCKNFVVDPRIVNGRKVTIIAPSRMSPAEAYRLFLVSLSTIGYTIVPKGRVVKIVESAAAKRDTVPLYKNGSPDATDQVVRYVYRPTYAPPDTLIQAFNALKSDPGEVQQIGSMVLITDYGSHVRDMISLAKLLDVPKGSDGIYLLPVRHADAEKLVDKLNQLLGIGAATATTPTPGKPRPGEPAPAVAPTVAPSRILVDERTNTLIIAGSAAAFDRVKALVERIDVALEIEGGASIHVYRLGSSIAEDLAKTLESAIGQKSTPSKPTPPGAPAPATEPDAVGTALEGNVRVIADKPTNSLIVMSSGRDYLALKEVIRQLDVPKRQVYIETVIMEVGAGSSLDFGASSHAGIPGTNMILGGVQLPPLSSLTMGRSTDGSLSLPTGLVGALIGKELKNSVSLFGKSIPSYGLLFQALGGNDNAQLISSPSIIGVDNEESKQKAGINIAYERGSSSFQNGGVTTQQNIERKPLNLEITVKPHVFVDDQVLLELKLDSEDLGGEDKLGQPIWNNRSMDTRVVIRDQQTVVIGGLTQERRTYAATKVPLLGDIPILGHLFKYTKQTKRKTTLIVMLTPYIIKDHMDLQQILERKLREAEEFSGSFAALDHARYTPKIDYRRKRGLVEEINRTVLSVEDDRAARAALRAPPRVEPGPVEYGPGRETP